MSENRFFILVWRFNALAIALGAALLLAIIAWEFTRDWRRAVFPTRTSQVLNVAPVSKEEPRAERQENRRFGAPITDTSGPIYALPQYADQTYQNRGISKESGGNRVNFLIINTAQQGKHWLFPQEASRLITDVRPLWYAASETKPVLLGHILHVISKDTNMDERLSRSDDGSLFYVTPQWQNPTEIAQGMKTILSLQATGPSAFDVIYSGAHHTTLRHLDFPEARLAFEIDLTDTR